MTTINRFPFFSHATSAATRVLIEGRRGELKNRGAGASFWFRRLSSVISEVPIDDLEVDAVLRMTTLDYQEVSVQLALTARIANPEAAVQRFDFAIDLATGQWLASPLQVLRKRILDSARQFAAERIAGTTLDAAISDGLGGVADVIRAGFAADERLAEAGIEVVGVRVVAIRPDEELERALQTTLRESIQAEADRATFDRRAQAVELERAIKENELNNRTQLERQETELVELAGENELRRTQQEMEREQLRAQATADQDKVQVDALVDRMSRVAQAENDALAQKLTVLGEVDAQVLIAAIAPDVLAALPAIDSVTITPDQLTGVLGKLLAQGRAA